MEERLGRERRVEVRGRRTLLDRCRAVQAGLPQPLEGTLAAATGLLERRRADRADEIGVLHVAPADGAVRLDLGEPPLEGPDLDLARPCVLERLGRAEEQIDEGAYEGHEPEQSGGGHEPVVVDPALRVAVHPERKTEPEHRDDEEDEVAPDLEAGRVEETVNRTERRRGRCAGRPGHSPLDARAGGGETPVRSRRLLPWLSR